MFADQGMSTQKKQANIREILNLKRGENINELDVLKVPEQYFDRTEAIDHEQMDVLVNMQKIRDGEYQKNKLFSSTKVKTFGLTPEAKAANEKLRIEYADEAVKIKYLTRRKK